jgi:hypothetical protein
MGEDEKFIKNLVEIYEGRRLFGTPLCGWEDILKLIIKKGGVDWIVLAPNRSSCRLL